MCLSHLCSKMVLDTVVVVNIFHLFSLIQVSDSCAGGAGSD